MKANDAAPVDIDNLIADNIRLRGETLVTGIILTQLLQSILKTQLTPYTFADRIVANARKAVEDFEYESLNEAMTMQACLRKSALEAVKHFENEIRKALPA